MLLKLVMASTLIAVVSNPIEIQAKQHAVSLHPTKDHFFCRCFLHTDCRAICSRSTFSVDSGEDPKAWTYFLGQFSFKAWVVSVGERFVAAAGVLCLRLVLTGEGCEALELGA